MLQKHVYLTMGFMLQETCLYNHVIYVTGNMSI